MTCDEAEYSALLLALDALSDMNDHTTSNLYVRLWTDSMAVWGQVSGNRNCKNPHLLEFRDLVRSRLKGVRRWNIKWHSRKNNLAMFGH
jgi:ribonuclease HI